MNIMRYSCPTCAGAIRLNDEKKVFECESCGGVFDYSYYDVHYSLLKEAFLALYNGEWNAALYLFDSITEIAPDNGCAMIGRVLAVCRATNMLQLRENERFETIRLEEFFLKPCNSCLGIMDKLKNAQKLIPQVQVINRDISRLDITLYGLRAELEMYQKKEQDGYCTAEQIRETELEIEKCVKNISQVKAERTHLINILEMDLENADTKFFEFFDKVEYFSKEIEQSEFSTAADGTGAEHSGEKLFSYVCPDCAGKLIKRGDILCCTSCGNEFDYNYYEREALLKKAANILSLGGFDSAKKAYAFFLSKEPGNLKAVRGYFLPMPVLRV